MVEKLTTSDSDDGFKISTLPTEDQKNLVGFFELLLKIDKRLDPARYESKKQDYD